MCDIVWRLHKGTCRLLQGPLLSETGYTVALVGLEVI